MNADATTRGLLAAILVALLLLVARSFLGGPPAPADDALPVPIPGAENAEEPEWGRYQVISLRAGAPMLLRTDTRTGEVSKLELRGGGRWQAFQEPAEGGAEEEGWQRYQVLGTRAGAPLLIRIDTVTGRAWKLPLRGGDGVWEPFDEAGGPRRAAAAPAREPAPREPADDAPRPLPAPPATPEEELDSYLEAATGEALPPDIRLWAIGKLAAIDEPQATDGLLQALESETPQVALAALEALEGRSDPRIADALEAAAEHPDDSVRRAARERLGE